MGAQPCASARRCARRTCPEDAVTSYEDLGDPQWKGRLCLRTSNNEYNQSLVADMLAKRGPEQTRALLESWMANEPRILGSDVDVLEAIAAGRCDVGLTNHYYLARDPRRRPRLPGRARVAGPGRRRRARQPLRRRARARAREHRADAIALIEHLTAPQAPGGDRRTNGEFAVNPDVPPAAHIADWADVKLDPIDVGEAGALLPEAVALMQDVGWK